MSTHAHRPYLTCDSTYIQRPPTRAPWSSCGPPLTWSSLLRKRGALVPNTPPFEIAILSFTDLARLTDMSGRYSPAGHSNVEWKGLSAGDRETNGMLEMEHCYCM
jgi:hypothetical protein